MPAAPRYKVFTSTGEYVASAKTPELGIAVALQAGLGSTVRDGYRVKDTIYKAIDTNRDSEFVRRQAEGLGPIRSVVDPAATVAVSSLASDE